MGLVVTQTTLDAAKEYAALLSQPKYSDLANLIKDWTMGNERWQRYDQKNNPIWTPLTYWLRQNGLLTTYRSTLHSVCDKYQIAPDDSVWVVLAAKEILNGNDISLL